MVRLSEPQRMSIRITHLEHMHFDPVDLLHLAGLAAACANGGLHGEDIVRQKEQCGRSSGPQCAPAVRRRIIHAELDPRRTRHGLACACLLAHLETKHITIKGDRTREVSNGDESHDRSDDGGLNFHIWTLCAKQQLTAYCDRRSLDNRVIGSSEERQTLLTMKFLSGHSWLHLIRR